MEREKKEWKKKECVEKRKKKTGRRRRSRRRREGSRMETGNGGKMNEQEEKTGREKIFLSAWLREKEIRQRRKVGTEMRREEREERRDVE